MEACALPCTLHCIAAPQHGSVPQIRDDVTDWPNINLRYPSLHVKQTVKKKKTMKHKKNISGRTADWESLNRNIPAEKLLYFVKLVSMNGELSPSSEINKSLSHLVASWPALE